MMFLMTKSIKPEAASMFCFVVLCFLLGSTTALAGHRHQGVYDGWHQQEKADRRYRDRDRRYYRHHEKLHYQNHENRYQKPFGKHKTKRQSIVDEQNMRKLKHHFRQWKGTPYRYGGRSSRGIDCSGFVSLTYRKLFAHQLPRSTHSMLKRGIEIRKQHLRPGDLVFFRQGRRDWHVGIYLNHNQFMHASNSNGVTISSLTSSHWKHRFHSARRFL